MTPSSLCLCSATSDSIIEACQSAIVVGFSILAIVSNVLTLLVLGRVRRRSSTETLLLFVTISELALPVVVLARYVYITFDDTIEDFPYFRIALFYAWNVFYVTSILLTLLLAARRYMAIEYAVVYQSWSSSKYTHRTLLVVYSFSFVLFLPVLFYKPNFVTRDANTPILCSRDLPKEVIYTSIMMATVYLKGSYTVKINYLLYISIYFFQLISPLILAVLSFKFMRSLNLRKTSPGKVKKKTKLILLVSLLILIRDLPLGLLSTYFVFFLPAPACLTTLRILTQELVIVMCSMNFVVLYYTNQKFKEAVPRLRLLFCSCSHAENGRHDEHVYSSTYRSTTASLGAA